jgi:hypothetical protein
MSHRLLAPKIKTTGQVGLRRIDTPPRSVFNNKIIPAINLIASYLVFGFNGRELHKQFSGFRLGRNAAIRHRMDAGNQIN